MSFQRAESRRGFLLWRGLHVLFVLSAMLAVAMLSAAKAEAAASQEKTSDAGARNFDIPAQALSSALIAFGEQAGLQFSLDSDLVAGKQSPGLKGSHRTDDALRMLLDGTGLVYRYTAKNTVTIEKAPNTNGAHLTGPVRIQGAEENGAAGINGSTDPTATEGTKSYTTSAMTIASKTAQSIKDTPQSVSVITQQQMQDENITDFTSLMNQATGISLVTGVFGPLTPTFYSRGFAVERLQVDGGAPMDMSNSIYGLVPVLDMAMYDHAEILRGADGLFNGYGDPGGVINLTRKRPLDHEQVVVEGQYGSWNNDREMIDVTAPLGFDGKLRGRAVIANQDQDYFYDTASSKKTLAYGVLEGDLSSTTTLSAGFDVTRQNTVPFTQGLPRYESGADLNLPRSTCLCFPWNRYDFDTKEAFARLDQALGENWSLKLNLARTQQDRFYKYGDSSGTINPATLAGATERASMGRRASTQDSVDATLNGSFDLFGHRQQLVVGANYANADGGGYTSYQSPITSKYVSPVTGIKGFPAINVFAFDPANYPEPADGLPAVYQLQYGTKQLGGYSTLRLTFWDPLHLILGLRYSRYQSAISNETLCTITGGCAVNGAVVPSGGVTALNSQTYSKSDLSPPSVALVYDLTKTLALYASYTSIYQDQSSEVDESGQPLNPVTGSNLEYGLKWSGDEGRINATASLYRLVQRDFGLFIDYGNYASTFGALPDGVHGCCYIQDPNLIYFSKGVDLEVTGQLLPGWQLSAGYTFNLNKYEGATAALNGILGQSLQSLSPKNLLKLWTSYQFQGGEWLRRLSIGGGLNAQTKSFTTGSACTQYQYGTDSSGHETATCLTQTPFSFTQGFYTVASARAAYQIDKRWSVALNLNNLFDRRYYQTVGTSTGGNWYGDPRNFMLTLRGTY